jgi:excisionase family DNA binding protein
MGENGKGYCTQTLRDKAHHLEFSALRIGRGIERGHQRLWDYEPLLNDVQAARFLGGLHPKTVQRMARRGKPPAYRIGRYWRFRASELDQWLRVQSQHPNASVALTKGENPVRKTVSYQQGCLYRGKRIFARLPFANGNVLSHCSTATIADVTPIMHALYNHAMRYEWMEKNLISLVRQSAKRERVPDILTVPEIAALLTQLREPSKTAVFVAFSTGLRVSELLGLKWEDVRFDVMEIQPSRAIVDQVVGPLKTDASGKPVPMNTALADVLLDWRGKCPYNQDADFIFGSPEKDGRQPYWPDSLMRKGVRPAAVSAGIAKHIGWHSFRRTLATLLQANGETVKTTQDMLRHATSRLTLDLYAQGTMPEKRMAQSRVTQAVGTAVVPVGTVVKSQVVVGA